MEQRDFWPVENQTEGQCNRKAGGQWTSGAVEQRHSGGSGPAEQGSGAVKLGQWKRETFRP